MKPESKIYTQRELELAHMLTMEYELNLEPGTYEAILDLKAMTRANVLRVFLHSQTVGKSSPRSTGGAITEV